MLCITGGKESSLQGKMLFENKNIYKKLKERCSELDVHSQTHTYKLIEAFLGPRWYKSDGANTIGTHKPRDPLTMK